jgi:hypothetical protein
MLLASTTDIKDKSCKDIKWETDRLKNDYWITLALLRLYTVVVVAEEWKMSIDEIMTTGEKWSTQRKTDPSVTLSAKNPALTGLGSKLGLCDEKPVTSHFSHGTALKIWTELALVYLYLYLLTYLLTPLSRVLLEKLTGSQLVKKFPTFYGTWRFITAFASACHLSLSWARSIQYMSPSHFLKIHLNIILPSTPGSLASVM